ncbi:MAG: hypothetical protein J5J00_17580 [Deltaproteobacteria bacterium]|nr:hypothetical protein [Deltaproteobacteria bacterium]
MLRIVLVQDASGSWTASARTHVPIAECSGATQEEALHKLITGHAAMMGVDFKVRPLRDLPKDPLQGREDGFDDIPVGKLVI